MNTTVIHFHHKNLHRLKAKATPHLHYFIMIFIILSYQFIFSQKSILNYSRQTHEPRRIVFRQHFQLIIISTAKLSRLCQENMVISLCLSDRQHTQHKHRLLSKDLDVICAVGRLQSQIGKHDIRKQMTGHANPPQSLNFTETHSQQPVFTIPCSLLQCCYMKT